MNSIAVHTVDDAFVNIPDNVKGFRSFRERALSAFQKTGLPNTRNEEYKYTDLSHQLENKQIAAADFKATVNDIPVLGASANTFTIVFENGFYRGDLSDNVNAEGLSVKDIHAVDAVEIFLKKTESSIDPLTNLNNAFFTDGIIIRAGKNFGGEKSIRLIYISTGENIASVTRNIISAEQGAKLNVVEIYLAKHKNNFSNHFTQIFCDSNSRVEISKVQSTGSTVIDQTDVEIAADANFHIHTINAAEGLTRNNLNLLLNGRNANAWLNGLTIGKNNSHTDNHTFVDHAMPDCYSDELYKAILNDDSKGIFNGKIFVRKDAQKTNAYQSNKNILLSDTASMYAKPQLEIYADDVKCSHGATTGQLDEEAIFYLRSRGISEHSAKALLTVAFANDILDRISNEVLREELKDFIYGKLTND